MGRPRSFKFFAQLPPEVRQEIWRIALTQDWEYTAFKRDTRGIKMVGKINLGVRQACNESRSVMKLFLTKVESETTQLARFNHEKSDFWFNLDRHLFFCTNYDLTDGLLSPAGLETQMRHIVINLRNSEYRRDTVYFVKQFCKSVRTVVVIRSRNQDDLIRDAQSYNNFSIANKPLFRESPKELDISQLLDDIDTRRTDNTQETVWGLSDLRYVLGRLPNGPPLLLLRRGKDLNAWRVCPRYRTHHVRR
ncbi:hypothetical protein F5Y06DRAFT_268126 [Hypoxylon sp. FL0890]|nr:hypothetical protein F5Y06DRAFT_268126 [Hypoxylon sp. FL0890]